MATENKVIDLSFEAGEDLSADQYRFVVLDTTTAKVRRPNAATDIPIGVLQNAPASGAAASVSPVGCGGVSKIVLGATLTAGVLATLEYVDAADAGKAKAAATTAYTAGILIEGGSEDDLGSILLAPMTVHV